jgi:hypothetical protein
VADLWNSDTDTQRNAKIANYQNDGAFDAFREAGFDVDNDVAYIKSNGASEDAPADDSGSSNDSGGGSSSNDEDWYNTTANAVASNHPDWSDDDVTNYMTYLVNNGTDYDGS